TYSVSPLGTGRWAGRVLTGAKEFNELLGSKEGEYYVTDNDGNYVKAGNSTDVHAANAKALGQSVDNLYEMINTSQDSKGGAAGDPDRFSVSRNFLATDKVPDSIFGIPVVSKAQDYTPADREFFRRYPEAGGYYDLGDGGASRQGAQAAGSAQADPWRLNAEEQAEYDRVKAAGREAFVRGINERIAEARASGDASRILKARKEALYLSRRFGLDYSAKATGRHVVPDYLTVRDGWIQTGRPNVEVMPMDGGPDRYRYTAAVDLDSPRVRQDPGRYASRIVNTDFYDRMAKANPVKGTPRYEDGETVPTYRHVSTYDGTEDFGVALPKAEQEHLNARSIGYGRAKSRKAKLDKGRVARAERAVKILQRRAEARRDATSLPGLAVVRQDSMGGKTRKAYPGSLNNPGNVEKRKDRRAGEVDSPHERWAKFGTPQEGLNAVADVLRQIADVKLAERNLPFTIRNYAEVYAPRNENDTDKYIRNISTYSGIDADTELDRRNVEQMSKLLRNVVRFESGYPHSQWFTDDEYNTAAELLWEGAFD
ncbi:MAG: hypothetical protein II265_06820, partial [Clostridia bacterium]|nr:hypothetical protein [Clostridia bacterium]